MKIAIVTDAWHPQINGVVTTYQHTTRFLREQGYEVATITPEQFKTVPCPTYPEIALSLVTRFRLAKLLEEAAPHAVHIATEGPLGWAARGACIKAGFPYTTTYHTRFPEYIRMRFPIPLALSYSVVRRFHNRAQRIMVATTQLMDELKTRGFTNLRLWTRGVDIELFRPNHNEAASTGQPIFTYLGRVAPEKNIEAFLALELVGTKYVIGDGPARAALQEKYPQVVFTGYKQGEELSNLLAASSVMVFPSLTDTFGVVQLEAMACGVPVAAYPANGPQSLITNGRNGWIDNDLKTAVSKCLAIDRASCRLFAESFSWQKSTAQFLSNLSFATTPFSRRGAGQAGNQQVHPPN